MSLGARLLNFVLIFGMLTTVSCENELVEIISSEMIRKLPGRPEGLAMEALTLKIKAKKSRIKLKKIATWHSTTQLNKAEELPKNQEAIVKIVNTYPTDFGVKESPAGPNEYKLTIEIEGKRNSFPVNGCAHCSTFEKDNTKAQLTFLMDGKEITLDIKNYTKEEEIALP